MKQLLFFLFQISCGISFAQISPLFNGDTTNYVDASGKKQGIWFINGNMKKDISYKADAIVESGYYVDNQKTGMWKQFYPSGIIKSEITFVNNRPNGHAVFCDEQGCKSEEGTWVGTHWVGPYAKYYPCGGVSDSFYFSNSERVHIQFDSTGKRISSNVLSNESRDGSMNGTVMIAMNHEKDSIKDSEIHFSIDSAFQSLNCNCTIAGLNKGAFNGEGYWTLYKNGQMEMKGFFHGKKLVCGIMCVYDENGLLKQIKKYKDGKYIGDAPLPADANK